VAGSLTVVGTGITIGLHLTPESSAAIDAADELLHLAADRLAETWLDGLHPRARSLRGLYAPGAGREAIYAQIVEAILAPVREGRAVCAAFYGHPGVFVRPSHEAIRLARAEGYDARMLAAVSAEDCLFADIGVDPATTGCASYDATDFLVHSRRVDTSVALILWQITVIGDLTAVSKPRLDNVHVLVERLREHYPPTHDVVVYEAPPFPVARPSVERVPLGKLAGARLTPLSTLFVPPASAPPVDTAMAARLGLSAR
jgi:uncharacterized protein YabN with tetrapyrrole methylase and pyrophosphatase domain